MWSRHKAGAGGSDGKIKREVAMSEQADLVLKKNAEIEAKMAAEEKINKKKNTERKEKKPLSLSASKRWGLKGKKCGAVGSLSLPTPSAGEAQILTFRCWSIPLGTGSESLFESIIVNKTLN